MTNSIVEEIHIFVIMLFVMNWITISLMFSALNRLRALKAKVDSK